MPVVVDAAGVESGVAVTVWEVISVVVVDGAVVLVGAVAAVGGVVIVVLSVVARGMVVVLVWEIVVGD